MTREAAAAMMDHMAHMRVSATVRAEATSAALLPHDGRRARGVDGGVVAGSVDGIATHDQRDAHGDPQQGHAPERARHVDGPHHQHGAQREDEDVVGPNS